MSDIERIHHELRRKKRVLLTNTCAFVAAWFFSKSLKSQRASPSFQPVRDIFSLPLNIQMKIFRFSIPEIGYLTRLLHIPDPYVSANRHRLPAISALALVLCRLSGTRSNLDIGLFFGYSESYVSFIVNEILNHIIMSCGNLAQFNVDLIKENASRYAEAIFRRCPLNNCIGFVDCTNRKICRPLIYQRLWYSGHKHFHAIKFQSWVLPDGIIAMIFGPYGGRVHDLKLWDESGLEVFMEEDDILRPYLLFGDQGYKNEKHLMCPFPGDPQFLTEAENAFNQYMLEPRLAVEWGFMRVTQLWQAFHRPAYLRVEGMPVGQMYVVAVLLTNLRTCMHGRNIISDYFDLQPPSCEQYLRLPPSPH